MDDLPRLVDDENKSLLADINGGHDARGIIFRLFDAGFDRIKRIRLEKLYLAFGCIERFNASCPEPLLGYIAERFA